MGCAPANLPPVEESYAARFADFLEELAQKIRSLTVDRLRRGVVYVSFGLIAAVLVLIAILFILIGIFRLISIITGVTGAYALIGGLFLVAGLLSLRKGKKILESPIEPKENSAPTEGES